MRNSKRIAICLVATAVLLVGSIAALPAASAVCVRTGGTKVCVVDDPVQIPACSVDPDEGDLHCDW